MPENSCTISFNAVASESAGLLRWPPSGSPLAANLMSSWLLQPAFSKPLAHKRQPVPLGWSVATTCQYCRQWLSSNIFYLLFLVQAVGLAFFFFLKSSVIDVVPLAGTLLIRSPQWWLSAWAFAFSYTDIQQTYPISLFPFPQW